MKESLLRRAVALHYDEMKDKAPKVVAKGSGLTAEKIIEEAKKLMFRFRRIRRLSN